MNFDLSYLTAVLPVPTHTYNIGSPAGWDEVERELGFTLPADYKAFVSIYGSGVIAGYLWPLNPFRPSGSLLQSHEALVEPVKLRQHFIETVPTALNRPTQVKPFPYPVYPDLDGLFAWGSDDQANVYFWQPIGHPDTWPTIIAFYEENETWKHERKMTEIIAGWISGTADYEPMDMGRHYLDDYAHELFMPYREHPSEVT